MSFSESGGVITQTGTDTDLTGLSGLTGVTRFGYVTTGSETFYIYDIGTNRLDIEGDLTINPEYNMLLTNCPTGTLPNMSINVRSTGTLTLGVKTVSGTATKYTIGTAIVTTEQGDLNASGSFHVESGGTIEGYGATIELSGPTRLRDGSYITVEDLTVVLGRNGQCQFRIEHNGANTSRVSITNNGIKLNGRGSIDEANLTTSGSATFDTDSFIFNFIKAKYQPASAGYPAQVFLNFDNGNNIANADFSYAGTSSGDGITYDGRLVDFRNVARRLRYIHANLRGGFCQTTKNLNFNLVDADFVGLTAVAYYAIDTDNGGRINFNGFDSTADLTYTGSGVGPALTVTPVVEYMAGQGTTRYIDDRLDSDTITFRFISYLTNIATSSPNLIGLGDLDLDIVNPADSSITEATKATVDAYTELETPEKFYDRAKSYLYDNYAGETATLVTRSGSLINLGSYNLTIDATAGAAFALAGSTITIKATTFTGDLTTTGNITLANGASILGTYTDASGTTAVKPISITGIVAGSRLQVYNVTTASEVVNEVVAGTSYSANYNEGTGYSSGDTVRVRLTCQSGTTACDWFSQNTVATSSGWNVVADQQTLTVYANLGVDGSTVTEYSLDGTNIQVDANDLDGTSTKKRLVAWYYYAGTTEAGIRNFFEGIMLEDSANAKIQTAIIDLTVDNTSSLQLRMSDTDFRLYRDDGSTWIEYPSSGGYGIDTDSGKVYAIEAGSGLSPSQLAILESRASQASVDAVPTNVWNHAL